jgi:hypothetical protein
LNEWIDCKVYYNDGRVINCLQIDRLVEIFDGSNYYGKCFSYFNRDYDRNNFENFSITKEDSIKFKLNLDHFNSILNNNFVEVFPALFMAIHSYKTTVAVPDVFEIRRVTKQAAAAAATAAATAAEATAAAVQYRQRCRQHYRQQYSTGSSTGSSKGSGSE